MRRVITRVLVVGLVSVTLLPAGSSSAEDLVRTDVRSGAIAAECDLPGDPLVIPPVTVQVAERPSVGRSVTWEVPAAGTDLEQDVVLGPVLTDTEGIATPPALEAHVRDRTTVVVKVAETDEARRGTGFLHRRVVGQDLGVGNVTVGGPQDYSRLVHLQSTSIKSLVRAEDGTCDRGYDPRTQVVVEGIAADGSIVPLDRRQLLAHGRWATSVHAPTVGRATLRVRAELPTMKGSNVHMSSIDVPRDTPHLGVDLGGALAYDQGDYYRIERGSSPSMKVFLDQQYWRPEGGAEPARTVEVRFRQASTGKVTRLADLHLVRDRNRRVDVLRRPMRTAGTYELTFRGNAFDEPTSMSFGVRFKPRITGFAARTTEGRPYRPLYRTITVRDGEGAYAQIEHKTRDGWVGSGRSQRIPASGTVRLGSRNDTSNDRTHRAVVYVVHRHGVRVHVATTPGSWKVRNR